MKKLFTMMMVGAAVFAFTGCGKKTTEQKATDATVDMQKQADSAAKDAQKAAEKAADNAADTLNKLTK